MSRSQQAFLSAATSAKPLFAHSSSHLTEWAPESWPVVSGWEPVLSEFWKSGQGRELSDFISRRLAAGAIIYPPRPLVALELTPPENVKVVILGQDPYHGPGQAEGVAFSVAHGVKSPPSLRNIFKELQRDLGQPTPESGSLVRWAREGVLLLNTSLTVEEGQPASHAKHGWESLTDALLLHVARTRGACVYMLWGAHAQAKRLLIEESAASAGSQVLILQANHPSPLSALRPPIPFMGCAHFSRAKTWLSEQGRSIDWALATA
jgi:uracil-DNA glycosylase